MKLKARDIVPNWPRGRSTLALCDWRCRGWEIVWHCFCRGYSIETRALLEGECLLERDYHQGQQALTDWFRGYREWAGFPPRRWRLNLFGGDLNLSEWFNRMVDARAMMLPAPFIIRGEELK